MARLVIWKCDGCGASRDGEVSHLITVQPVVLGGIDPSVRLYEGEKIDLCERCKERLFREINPRQWVRTTPPAKEG